MDDASLDRSASRPFATLTPDRVLDALDALGIEGDGRLLAMNSYENRVYQVGIEGGPPVVVKFYRPHRWTDQQILEEHAFAFDLVADEIPVVAPLESGGATLHHFEDLRFAVFPKRGGRAPELDSEETLAWLGRFLGRMHAVGARRPYIERPPIDIERYGVAARDWLVAAQVVAPDVEATWRGVVDAALAGVRMAFERAGPIAAIRVHGDCHGGNILWTEAGPHVVDLDDSAPCAPVQDLWMLLSGDSAAMSRQLGVLLREYRRFFDFEPASLHLIEALRTLRLIHYAAWIARRWDDPAFPIAFPWFTGRRYWEDRILELREQTALMAEAPLAMPD